jgi:hypothetical protein
MAALDPRIKSKDMGGHPADKDTMLPVRLDGRVKPGHDQGVGTFDGWHYTGCG